jgi:hypothetical protein
LTEAADATLSVQGVSDPITWLLAMEAADSAFSEMADASDSTDPVG